jgi:outer membrane protein OmpA-like peptidoglycan-associated protein
MLRLAVTLILLLLMLFGGAVLLLDMQPVPVELADKQAKERAKSQQGKGDVDAVQEALTPAPQSAGDAPTFDIARIDPEGTSVFAGRADPNSAVTITADGKELGTVQADENGEWTFTTEAKIPNPDAKLALFKAPPGSASRVADAATLAPVRPNTSTGPAAKSAQDVTSNMIKDLEGMVAAARTAEGKQVAAAPPPPPTAGQAAAPGTVAPAVTQPQQANIVAPPRIETSAVPVPVTFIFNEATLTGEGRRAAGLLLEYLRIKRFPKIKLTGHADERGTDALNLALSAQRLQTVARFLREGGFDGRLELVPKGKTEPYSGVVRGDFSQEDLYQLDRRVELVVSR